MGTTSGSNTGDLGLLKRIEVLSAENTELKNSNNELQEALESLRISFSGLSEKITMKRIYGTSIAEALGQGILNQDTFGVAAFLDVSDGPPEVRGGYLVWIKSHLLSNTALLIAISMNVSKVQKLFFGSLAKGGDAAVWYQS